MLKVRIKKNLPGFNLDIAFDIDQESLAIIGPSGSGKTMTLLCIAGLLQPDEAYIELNGRVLLDSTAGVNVSPQLRRVGFVFQNYALFPHMNVRDNIAFGIRRLARQEIDRRVDQLLDKMNMQEMGHRYPGQLSGGQQQRVAVARALAPEPEVMLMDEPFSALDTHVKERLERELLLLHQYYKGELLFVTHDLAEAYKLCSKMAVYESGRVIQFGSRQQVIGSPANRTVARLTGVKNLMDGFIADIGDANVWVRIPGMEGLLKVALEDRGGLRQDQGVTVGIRSESISVNGSVGDNTFLCTVDQAVEGVVSINYSFLLMQDNEPNGRCLEASLFKSGAPMMQSGETCRLYLPPELLFIIR